MNKFLLSFLYCSKFILLSFVSSDSESDKEFSQSDFYQLFAYTHIFLKEQKENYKDEICELMSLKIYYPKSDYLKNDRIFEYFDNTEIKIVPLDIETELLKDSKNLYIE